MAPSVRLQGSVVSPARMEVFFFCFFNLDQICLDGGRRRRRFKLQVTVSERPLDSVTRLNVKLLSRYCETRQLPADKSEPLIDRFWSCFIILF